MKAHFGSYKQNKNQLELKDNSNWTPDKLPSCVDTFNIAVDHDIANSLVRLVPKDNLTKSQREALENQQ